MPDWSKLLFGREALKKASGEAVAVPAAPKQPAPINVASEAEELARRKKQLKQPAAKRTATQKFQEMQPR